MPRPGASELDHEGPGRSQEKAQDLAGAQSFAEEDPRQNGDLNEHRVVDDARLQRGQLPEREVPEREGEGRVHDGEPCHDRPPARREDG